MTLIASTLSRNTPFFLADILMSSEVGNMDRVPTSDLKDNSALLPNPIYKPHALNQKLYVIEKNVCALFAGLEVEIKDFLKELQIRCSYYGPNTVTDEHINKFIKEYDFKSKFSKSAFLIVVAAPIAANSYSYNYFAHGPWTKKETMELGTVVACGSGTNQYLSHFNMSWNSASVGNPNVPLYQNLLFIANLLAYERRTMENYEYSWGAGFEIASYDGSEFKKIDNLAYVLWHGTFDDNGNISGPTPDLILYYKYIDDVLFVTSIEMYEISFTEQGDRLIIKSHNYRVDVFAVPRIDKEHELMQEDLSRDYSFDTSLVGQGFSLIIPPNGINPMALFSEDGSVAVRHKQGVEIEIIISLMWINTIRSEAKAAFPRLTERHV